MLKITTMPFRGEMIPLVRFSPLEEPIAIRPPAWVGVDFDGTLANSSELGEGPFAIFGKPVAKMVEIVKQLRTAGVTVKLFTARAGDPDCLLDVAAWLEAAGLEQLPLTNKKDYYMVRYYDDMAIQVVPDQGVTLLELLDKQTARKKQTKPEQGTT